MKSIQELREARAAKVKETEALNGNEKNWTPEKREESQAKFDSLLAEVKAFDQEIERIEAVLNMTAKGKVLLDNPASADSSIKVGADREAQKPFANLGEQLRAIYLAGPGGAKADKRLLEINATAGTGSKESLSEEGGFLVQQDFATELTSLADDDSNGILLNAATKRTISSAANSLKINGLDETSRATGSRYGGVRVYTTAELEQMTESRPKFSKIELKLDKLTGLYYASDEELEDVTFLAGEVEQLFRKEFAFKTQDLIYRGAGSGEPLGVLNANCTISVAKELSQDAATIVTENVNKMYNRMPAGLRGESFWVANQDTEPSLELMYMAIGTAGVPTYMPPGGAADAPYGRLKGRPVYFIEQCDTLGTVGDIMLLAMSTYIWATKGGIQAASSIHLKFDYNQTAFRWTLRVDGQPRYLSSLTPYKGATKVSPYIKLATRS